MKKTLVALFIIGIAIPVFAKIKEKHVIGTWSYTVEVDQMVLEGKFVFEKKDGELTGNVLAHDNNTYEITLVEIRDNDVLYFEIVPEYDVFEITLKISKTSYEGVVGTPDGDIPITGEKIE
jgi:hypothetical protein